MLQNNPFATILDTLPSEMDIASVPGLIIAHIQGGQVNVYPLGVINAETREPVTADTVFPAASLSKPVFAYGVFGLVEKGLLDLDHPLSGYLPLPEAADLPQLNEITARQVLSHSTGLQNWRFSLEDKLEFDFPPGKGFRYSGEGYFYLQRVVEHLTGQGIEGFMLDHVLHPLGMVHSSTLWLPEYEQTIAKGHRRVDYTHPQKSVPSWSERFGKKMWEIAKEEGRPVREWRYDDVVAVLPRLHPNLNPLGNDMIPNVAASLLTTVTEYAQFVIQIMTHAPAGMLTPTISVNRALSWGLGWGLAHNTQNSTSKGTDFWHWGDNDTFKNFIYAEPYTGHAIVIFTNGERGMRLCERIIRRVMGYEHPAFLWL